MEFFEVITNRYSSREYATDQISEQDLEKILSAGQAAPIAMGDVQSYMMTVVQRKELLDRIDDASAKAVNKDDYHPLYGAPTLVIVSAKLEEDEVNMATSETCACIVENMHLAATALGLGSIVMMTPLWAFEVDEKLSGILRIPESFFPIATLAIGHTKDGLKRSKKNDRIKTEVIK